MLQSLCTHKPARLRQSQSLRALIQETRITKDDLVMPLFFKETKGSEPIASMPGIAKMGQVALLKEIETLQRLGIKAVLLFGSTDRKNKSGSLSYDENSPMHKAIKAIKQESSIILITDVCLCAYTDHGHCGVLKSHRVDKNVVRIDGERTLQALAKIAVSYAASGADMVAPSAMADGQVKAIREALDNDGYNETSIMAYSAKFASCFYGPFRDIYDSSPEFGDRRSYQMDSGNRREALREAMLDIEEGADIIMVKPALAYLDIIRDIRDNATMPVAAYNVSGEYSMVKAAAAEGWLNEELAAMEILRAIKRAGADIIITYWAKEAVGWISRQG